MRAERLKFREGKDVVALVSANGELHQRLRGVFKSKAGPEFYAIEGSIIELKAHIPATGGPALLIADLDPDRDLSVEAIEELRHSGFGGAIVAISSTLDEVAVRALLRLRVSDWLLADANAGAIVAACTQALSARNAAQSPSQVKCVTMLPAIGGAGTTTIAIQTAFLAAHRDRAYQKTCLIDFNFQSGVMADYLDLRPGFDVEAVAATPERLDARLLEVMVSRHPSGIAVLAPARAAGVCRQVAEGVIAHVLQVASEMFANIVIDMPSQWQTWSDYVVAGSDEVLVVTEFTVPALRRARETVDAVRPRLAPDGKLKVIVNKHREALFGGGLKKGDARELLGEHLGGFVSEDHALVREAINRGQPLIGGRPSNRISREIAKIVIEGAGKT
jgi:pilus assembly protein CpaE